MTADKIRGIIRRALTRGMNKQENAEQIVERIADAFETAIEDELDGRAGTQAQMNQRPGPLSLSPPPPPLASMVPESMIDYGLMSGSGPTASKTAPVPQNVIILPEAIKQQDDDTNYASEPVWKCLDLIKALEKHAPPNMTIQVSDKNGKPVTLTLDRNIINSPPDSVRLIYKYPDSTEQLEAQESFSVHERKLPVSERVEKIMTQATMLYAAALSPDRFNYAPPRQVHIHVDSRGIPVGAPGGDV